jgi:peptidoglycan/xylan/chitin deacetylase (PgdA/CDA1 family)
MKLFITILTLIATYIPSVYANNSNFWPDNKQAAVSLSYDDSLLSHLTVVLPALNKANIKGSFYLTLASPNVVKYLNQWKQAAAQGHELGNHSINHDCIGELPGREWVKKENDLSLRSLTSYAREINNANQFLTLIDGQKQRTFTVPCGDIIINNQAILPLVRTEFVGIKSQEGPIPESINKLDRFNMPVWSPIGKSSSELIAYVELAAEQGTVANITFHGIGNEYLVNSITAHQQLLDHLVKHKDKFWVTTFKNISLHIKQKQPDK